MPENPALTAQADEAALDQRALTDRVLHAVVLLILVLTVGVYVIAIPLAAGWIQRPFVGAFIERALVFNDIRSQGPDKFPAFTEGVQPFDRLTALNGVPVSTDAQLNAELQHYVPGQVIEITVERRSGGQSRVPLTVQSFSFRDLLSFFIIPYLIGLVYLGIGV